MHVKIRGFLNLKKNQFQLKFFAGIPLKEKEEDITFQLLNMFNTIDSICDENVWFDHASLVTALVVIWGMNTVHSDIEIVAKY